MNQDIIGLSIAAVVPQVLATGLCKSLCTIQVPDGVLIDAGQPSGNYTSVAGLINLIVMSAPTTSGDSPRPGAEEQKTEANVQSFAVRHVWLAGFYPLIQDYCIDGAQVVIDGLAFDLLGAECDSQAQTTRLHVRTTGL